MVSMMNMILVRRQKLKLTWFCFIFSFLFCQDIGLEFEELERYENFKEFYYDVLPEFERFGHVVVFKVCLNSQIHLRGNVYVQYET